MDISLMDDAGIRSAGQRLLQVYRCPILQTLIQDEDNTTTIAYSISGAS
jgi:hypothetical protein